MVRRGRQCTKAEARGVLDLKALLDTPPWDWPADAGKQFLQILTNHDAMRQDRLIAAELAGDFTVVDEALSDALLLIAGSADEPEELRARAAIFLGPVLDHCDTCEFDDPDRDRVSEQTFHRIQGMLRQYYLDDSVPAMVRRKILEASVRAPEDWHADAIREAYSSGNPDWILTAVFAMRWVRGFDEQILDALKSTDPQIQCEAVYAAGNWDLGATWDTVVALAQASGTSKELRLAAIGAVGTIRPAEAREILSELTEFRDEEIAEAAAEALMTAEAGTDGELDEDEDEDDWIN